MSAPERRASARIVSRAPSSAAAFELRVIEPSLSDSSSVVAVVKLVLVSTTPVRAGLIAMTPLGMAAMRSRTRRAVAPRELRPRPGAIVEREPVVRARVSTGDRCKLAVAAVRNAESLRAERPPTRLQLAGWRSGSLRRRAPKLEWRRLERRQRTRASALIAFTRPAVMSLAGVTALRTGHLDPQRDVIRRDG